MAQIIRPEIRAGEAILVNPTNVNVILGRNGAGKSRFLRKINEELRGDPAFNIRYISPERAGVFKRDGNAQTNMENDPNWLYQVRRRNQADNFKGVSANLLREVEVLYLRKLQNTPSIREDTGRNFKIDRLDRINELLLNVTLENRNASYEFFSGTGESISADQISSGESEAVALAAEILYFFDSLDDSKLNLLLLDEPDVHLHPDLQARLARFLLRLIDEVPQSTRGNVAVCIATHSTPLVCALAGSDYSSIGTKAFGNDKLTQTASSDQLRKAAPFFGHPLSLSLNGDVLLIVEGEDDERVWQQAARSSQGRVRLFPVLAVSVDQQSDLETFCAPLLESIYDEPIAYSLRDGDGHTGDLQPVGPVRRFRLNCYAIENTLISEECLAVLGMTWTEFVTASESWIAANDQHSHACLLRRLIESDERMRNEKIKQIRQLICTIARSKKPWEVVVGQAIGTLAPSALKAGQTSLASFIGHVATRTLLCLDEINLDTASPLEAGTAQPTESDPS
jgi:ABC-type histidine transport system ATPase subunit